MRRIVLQLVAHGCLVGKVFLAAGLFGFFLFFFLEVGDNLVDNLVALLLGHCGKAQQRVLQVHILRVHGEFVEYVASAFDSLVIGERFGQQGHCFGIIRLGFLVVAAKEVQFAETYLVHGFINTVRGRFFVGKLVVFNGLCGIAMSEVQVAYGVVYLVEIFLVAVVARHTAQGLYFGLYILAHEYFALLDTGVEFGAVRGRRRTACSVERLVCFGKPSEVLVYLSQKEVEPCFLCATRAFHSLDEEWLGIGIIVGMDIEIGVHVVVEPTQTVVGQLIFLIRVRITSASYCQPIDI